MRFFVPISGAIVVVLGGIMCGIGAYWNTHSEPGDPNIGAGVMYLFGMMVAVIGVGVILVWAVVKAVLAVRKSLSSRDSPKG